MAYMCYCYKIIIIGGRVLKGKCMNFSNTYVQIEKKLNSEKFSIVSKVKYMSENCILFYVIARNLLTSFPTQELFPSH